LPEVVEVRWWQWLLHRRKPARLRNTFTITRVSRTFSICGMSASVADDAALTVSITQSDIIVRG
jgi:hypothetical protein